LLPAHRHESEEADDHRQYHQLAMRVSQPGCRTSRAHDPARGTLLILLVTGML